MKSYFSIARQNLDGDNYFILLILTDGVITDMPQTSEAIVQVGQVYVEPGCGEGVAE